MIAADLEKKLNKKKHKTTSELRHVISKRTDQNPNFCLFLGAGASRSSGIRTAGEMVKKWREEVYKDLLGKTDDCPTEQMKKWLSENQSEWYEENREYASLIERVYPLPTNRRKFIETEVSGKTPSIGYAYLVRIAEGGLLRTIFTTNFDDLLNEAFYQFSAERALVCAHDSSVHYISITSRRAKIIKLHGDYLFDDLKNTSHETKYLAENMQQKLSEFLKEYGLILAGYSGSDKSITRPLLDMCGKDKDGYLRNGLYWCFRAEDEVTPEALEILQCPNCFYVLTPGYDELMAEIYGALETEAAPLNLKLASDRASNLIAKYLENPLLKSTCSPTIQKHLESLEADKNGSLLSDLMRDLNAERMASAGLTDKSLLVYLDVERALKDRDPERALARLGEELSKTADRRFKELLLSRRFVCSQRLSKFGDAREAVRQMLDLEPENYYMSLNECALLEKRVDRLDYLEKLKTRHPFSSPVLNSYADELRDALERQDKIKGGVNSEHVLAALQRSTEVNPSVENEAWSQLFNFHASHKSSKTDSLNTIVDKHLAQDPFSAKTSVILLQYCRKFKTAEYKKKPLFEYLLDGYKRHFPRDYSAHLEVIVDASIEFESHHLLRPLLEEANQNEYLKDDSQFAEIMMNVHYDVFRDLSGAIALGEKFLKKNKKTSIEILLLHLYLDNGATSSAHQLHNGLKGAIDLRRWLGLQSEIFEREGRYQDAIDSLNGIPDRRDFEEKYTGTLSFLELKLSLPAKAQERCRAFLHPRAFPVHFETENINYEYSKKLQTGHLSKPRVEKIAEATENESVKGVCKSLLEKDAEALEIFRKEAQKRFSKINEFLRWPVISRHEKELRQIHDDLAKAKRSLTDLPTS